MSERSLDFETKSSVDIKLGIENYSRSPDCEVLTMSYRDAAGNMRRWNPTLPEPTELLDYVRAGGGVRGWNAGGFEYLIWNNVCVLKYGWPPLPMGQIWDTMVEAAAMNLPQSLERCGEALQLPAEKLKSKRGKVLIRKLCVRQKPTKNQPHVWLTRELAPDLHEELAVYCDDDVVAEEAIAKKLRPLSAFERNIWLLTQRVNLRGVPVALDEVENICEIVRLETDRLNAELREITKRNGMKTVPKATARAAMLRWFNEHPALSGLDPIYFEAGDDEEDDTEPDPFLADMKGETLDKVLKRQDLPDDVRRVLQIRRQCAQSSTAKYPTILKIVARDSTLKGLHSYHGASTGRWASRGKWNAQNIPRGKLGKADIAAAAEILGQCTHEQALMMYGDQLMDAAVSCLRGIIKAPEGYEFVDADYSSVENRVASWLAGQDDKLAMFAAGLDEYKVFASTRLFHCAYDEVTPDQRQKTKPVILGGIFGLGAVGLVDYAEKYGVKMTLEESKENIKALRLDYDKVQACWYAAGDAALEAVRNPGTWQKIGDKLSMIVHRNALWLKLPSGRLICWMRPRIDNLMVPWKEKKIVGYDILDQPIVQEVDVYKDVVTVEQVDSYTRAWKRGKLIGSSIFQSATQATARDILACGLVNVEAAGYPVVLMVHDELMALVKKGFGSAEEFGNLMIKPEDWYATLPLAFEGFKTQRFKK